MHPALLLQGWQTQGLSTLQWHARQYGMAMEPEAGSSNLLSFD
jgi:hypothetical protein